MKTTIFMGVLLSLTFIMKIMCSIILKWARWTSKSWVKSLSVLCCFCFSFFIPFKLKKNKISIIHSYGINIESIEVFTPFALMALERENETIKNAFYQIYLLNSEMKSEEMDANSWALEITYGLTACHCEQSISNIAIMARHR